MLPTRKTESAEIDATQAKKCLLQSSVLVPSSL